MAWMRQHRSVVRTEREESSDEQVDHRKLMVKIAWHVLPLMMVAYFINSLDKTNISLAALSMDKALGLNGASFGLASGLFFVGYFIFEIPSNLIMNRVGARIWMTRIMVSWGIVSAATAFVQGPTSLYGMRILLGLCEAGFYPGMLVYLTYWFPAQYRAKMLAYFIVGGGLAGVVGSPLSGWVLDNTNGLLGLSSWQVMFIVEGIPAAIVGVICLFTLTDKPKDAAWLTTPEKAWLEGTIDAERQRTNAHGGLVGALPMMKDVRVMVLSVAYFAKCFGQYALTFFLPQMIVAFEADDHRTYSTFHVSVLTAIPALIGLVLSIPWARHSDRTGERVWHSALPMFLGTAGICVSALLHAPLPVMIALCVVNIGISCQSQAFFQIPTVFLTGAAAAGGLAMINAVGNLGGFAAPYAFGWLKDSTGNFEIASYAMGAVMALGGIITVFSSKIAPNDNSAQLSPERAVARA